jgi:hypothetical protein
VAWKRNPHGRFLLFVAMLPGVAALAACTGNSTASLLLPQQTGATASAVSTASRPAASTAPRGGTNVVRVVAPGAAPLPGPAALQPFPGTTAAYRDLGRWQPAGRLVTGKPAVYETLLVPPGDTKRAGIAWMDTSLLSARLYSGSLSPGGGPYKYTAPVAPSAASSLVAAFNGGFQMKDAHGGYYTEGRMIRPLVRGAASLVIYADGAVTIGAWGSDVTMTPSVVAVRQNLYPLVVNGAPAARASTRTWRAWGGTCPCGRGQHGTDQQWRSGLGVTADGALVYVVGPGLTPPQVADLLVRAGAVRGMELDINPSWPVFAAFKPATPGGLAAPSNGVPLTDTSRGPATFFDPRYNRDFITMSAWPVPGSR